MSEQYLVTVLNPGFSPIALTKDLRQETSLSLKDASDVANGAMSLEVADKTRARYIAAIVNKAGGSATIQLASASSFTARVSMVAAPPLAESDSPEPTLVHAADLNVGTLSGAHADEHARANSIADNFASRVRRTWTPPSAKLQEVQERLREQATDVHAAASQLRQALKSRGIDHRPTNSNQATSIRLDDWLAEAAVLTFDAHGSLPILKSSKLAKLKMLQDQAFPLLNMEDPLRSQLEAAAVNQIERHMGATFEKFTASLNSSWTAAISDNPRSEAIDWWKPAWDGHRLENPRAPTVCPATANLQSIEASVSVTAPEPSGRTYTESSRVSDEAGLARFQVEIDLDRDGGFVTADKRAIETAAIDLLGQLPGGRVKVDVIDPLELGDSARFLYDLNDAGDRILADAVWTTTEHVGKVLVQLEEHITFVTQKYLQGRESLSEYNIEAGEISEPYRLLILYDFPAGFSRDGKHFDEEHLSRLQRLAAVGRRAGVYIFVHMPELDVARRRYVSPLVQLTPTGLGLTKETGAALSLNLEAPVVVGSRHVGKVTKLTSFGAFLSLPNGRDGLLHRSEYQKSQLLGVDMEVEVEVIEIGDRDKISLGLPGAQRSNHHAQVAGSVEPIDVSDLRMTWEVQAQTPPTPAERHTLFAGLLRDLQNGERAKVEPATLARLSQSRQVSDVARGLPVESLTDVDDSSTWWRSNSTERLQLSFGRMGASDVARMEFNSALESSALIGGRTGSGKSYLIHALIMDAVTRYSPDELTLYLCDLKEGVEFKQYADANLPHARAIAIESNREFAVSLLEALDQEITDRGALFKTKAGGTAVNISQFRQESGQTWPRVMIVIDEFHKLFEQDDRLARRAMQLLERVIKEGRAFGVHTVLASQSLANVDATFKSLAGQIPYRLVLASSDNDSRLLLGDENADAKLLTKAGEGILNAKGGARESNQRFQTAYWAPEQRQNVLEELEDLAARAGFDRHPHVFEGNAEVSASDYPTETFVGDGLSVVIPVGAPMSMAPPVVTRFERGPGGNLLVVDVDGLGVLATLVTSLLAQGVDVTAIDFAAIEHEWEHVFDALTAAGLDKPNRRVIDDIVGDLSKEVAERHNNREYRAAPRVLVLMGVHRARELDPDSYDDESLHSKLKVLAKDGPEVGVHLIAWADRKASLDRRLDASLLKEFGLRMLGRMNADDSRSLADTEQASVITPAQLVFDDFDKAVTLVARRLHFPGVEWISQIMGADHGPG